MHLHDIFAFLINQRVFWEYLWGPTESSTWLHLELGVPNNNVREKLDELVLEALWNKGMINLQRQ